MNTLLQKSLIALTLAAAGLAVQAQQPAPTAAVPTMPQVEHREARQQAEHREARQQARIDQGAQSGSLTPREQRRLQREQRGIAKAETKAEADGKVTVAERQKLNHMQNHASRNIRRQKHDAQHAATVTTPGTTASTTAGAVTR